MLRPGEELPAERAEKLGAIEGAGRALLAHRPIDPARLAAEIEAAHRIPIDGAGPAPRFAAPWAEMRTQVLAALGRIPAGGVMLIGDTAAEREWCAAARLGGYLAAERYFPGPG